MTKNNTVNSYNYNYWENSKNPAETMRYKFLKLSDDEIKTLCKTFYKDSNVRGLIENFYSDEYDDFWKLETKRCNNGDLICATLHIAYYDSAWIGLNCFGHCFIDIAPERFPRENVVDITIDKFLEKYLNTDH